MKLKYYLRGIGIGIIVTTIVLAIALNKKTETLTDAQIREKAAQLGMVDETLLEREKEETASGSAVENSTSGGDASETEDTSGAAETTAKATETASETTTKASTKASTAETTAKSTEKTTQSKEESSGSKVTVEIGASDWSNHVASKLEAAGLVNDASDFDQYLIRHGYETRIRSGSHTFRKGADYEELAKELVSDPD